MPFPFLTLPTRVNDTLPDSLWDLTSVGKGMIWKPLSNILSLKIMILIHNEPKWTKSTRNRLGRLYFQWITRLESLLKFAITFRIRLSMEIAKLISRQINFTIAFGLKFFGLIIKLLFLGFRLSSIILSWKLNLIFNILNN